MQESRDPGSAPDLTLRDFGPDDADAVSRLARAAWEQTYRNIYSEQYIDDFVSRFYSPGALLQTVPAARGGESQFSVALNAAHELIGFCHVGRGQDGGFELYRIYLRPDVIGHGVGRTLLQRAESFIRQSGVNHYHCRVHRLNKRARSFYERCGFVRLPERDERDELYLQKILPPASQRATGSSSRGPAP
jgi:diamine N-acetyltransferase